MTQIFSKQSWRHTLVLGIFCAVSLVLVWRAFDLQVLNNTFYKDKGANTHIRMEALPAYRGIITDRHDEPLAISTPVDSVWVNPKIFANEIDEVSVIAEILNLNAQKLLQRIATRQHKGFVYLKRRINPDLASRLDALDIPGLYMQREYRRFYPTGEVSAHVLGFTNIDDMGQEGIEYAYDAWLQGQSGSLRVLQNRRGQIVSNIEKLSERQEGKSLSLSIDKRLQYLAYKELKAAVKHHNALSGSFIILDVSTGEVLAMVNQPAFNPNSRNRNADGRYRNRAFTDVFEPGSTLKPIAIAAAVEQGYVTDSTLIDTSPGQFYVGRNLIKDVKNYGQINIETIIQKSSNVGISKVALSMDKEVLWQTLVGFGFGSLTGAGFPGEASGTVNDFYRWRRIDQATVSYGYGLSTSLAQLARAYAVIANQGRIIPLSMLKVTTKPESQQVISPSTSQSVLNMMEQVVSTEGTAPLARIEGYRVAGKTGTVKKIGAKGYSSKHYLSLFAGIVPASQPRLVGVVMIDDPSEGDYYGGIVAAPVFSKVMSVALRMMNIYPDDLLAINAAKNTASVVNRPEVSTL
ncbi:Cell division protein FtsI [Peptidoglycan synthetase] [hydrothermal vent metagenome]|uniref:Cell division protein FtsI [Peptidoglycan synthetase] n=1 Tax=hydrothermal vent metagenome TaxID=652676 RepID=A0A3B0ZBQ5_9ZZZZ